MLVSASAADALERSIGTGWQGEIYGEEVGLEVFDRSQPPDSASSSGCSPGLAATALKTHEPVYKISSSRLHLHSEPNHVYPQLIQDDA